MHADPKGALARLNSSYKAFEHKGKRMSKEDVRKVLEYGIKRGYETTAQLTDEEVDFVLAKKGKDLMPKPDFKKMFESSSLFKDTKKKIDEH